MRTIITTSLMAALLMVTCSRAQCQPTYTPVNAKALRLTLSIPGMDKASQQEKDTVSALVISYKNFTVYQQPMSGFRSLRGVTYNNGVEQPVNEELQPPVYFAVMDGAVTGIYIDSNAPAIMIDSFFEEAMVFQTFYYWRNKLPAIQDSLVMPLRPAGDGIFIEHYRVSLPCNDFWSDTIICYYTTGLKNYPFSLSPVLDSARGLKLFKISIPVKEAMQNKLQLIPGNRAIELVMEACSFNIDGALRKSLDALLATYGFN